MPSLLEELEGRCSVADHASLATYLSRFQQAHPEAFELLTQSVTAQPILVTVCSYSNFLAEEVIQHPTWLSELAAAPDLYRVLSVEDFTGRLEEFLGAEATELSPLPLAVFRRQQLLRILVRDVLGYGILSEITEEISNLSCAILDVTYRRIRAGLIARYGTPRYIDSNGELRECGFSILALGKLGGCELNYSSDIDLIFMYSGNGSTDGAERLSNKEFFKT